jgi:hypothetical protein
MGSGPQRRFLDRARVTTTHRQPPRRADGIASQSSSYSWRNPANELEVFDARSRYYRSGRSGGPEVLSVIDRVVREPGPGEVRIAVKAAAVNLTDIGVRTRWRRSTGAVDAEHGRCRHRGIGR